MNQIESVRGILNPIPESIRPHRLTSQTVEARLHNARSLLVEVFMRQFDLAFGGVSQLDDNGSERIANAVMDRPFLRR